MVVVVVVEEEQAVDMPAVKDIAPAAFERFGDGECVRCPGVSRSVTRGGSICGKLVAPN